MKRRSLYPAATVALLLTVSCGDGREFDSAAWRDSAHADPLSIDSEWLVLRFDSAGRVAEHRILTD